MVRVEVFGTPYCPYCVRARHLLERKKIEYRWIDVSQDSAARQQMISRSGGYTVPQIFIDEQPIGGCDEMHALECQGKLDAMLDQRQP